MQLQQPAEEKVIWFQATDIPLREGNPFKTAEKNSAKSAVVWERFSDVDSLLLEQAFLKAKEGVKGRSSSVVAPISVASASSSSTTTTVLPYALDGLFEVNVITREIYPVYWDGPIYEVRRGIWFEPSSKGSFSPCDENLTLQLEDGLKKYAQLQNQTDWRWPLLGPLLGQFVSYESSQKVAFLQSDYLHEKLARALTQSSGTKLIRGWDEVQNIIQKKPPPATLSKAKKVLDGDDPTEQPSVNITAPLASSPNNIDQQQEKPKSSIDDSSATKMRKIDHLVFVIHGIGQKLSATMGTGLSFINDCDLLRSGLKEATTQLNATFKANKIETNLPEECGVQVIPIHWRQKLNVTVPGHHGEEVDEDSEEFDHGITLGDIMPEGIPGIRMLISDVILDVLLYMTPRYRREMINHVSLELNRVYKLFKERNQDFQGSVSIYGHSLGSVIAFDIATHQTKSASADSPISAPRPQSAGVDLSDVLGGGNIMNSRLGGLIAEETVVFDAPKLDFEIVNLYSVGSPIGMFLFLGGLALRPPLKEGEEEPNSTLQTCRPVVGALYNIYHAYDPVAHRVEPLVSSKLTTLRPFHIPYTKGGITKTVKGIEQAGNEVLQRGRDLLSGLYSSAGNMMGSLSSLSKVIPASQQGSDVELDDISRRNSTTENQSRISALNPPPTTDQRRLSVNSNSSRSPNAKSPDNGGGLNVDGSVGVEKSPSKRGDAFSKSKPLLHPDPTEKQKAVLECIASLNPYGRLDFVLQESILENPYLSSIAVHMAYWTDSDVNTLLIRTLYNLTSNP